MSSPGKPRLVVVGCGIQAGRHMSRRAEAEIRRANQVFVLADPIATERIKSLNSATRSLADCYGESRDRRDTYREMEALILAAVEAGRDVCAVFYGHPGVFADVPHQVIEQARAAGVTATMEPGISAEACLYADLGIDPGRSGVQSFEATQFLICRRSLDPTALVLLWQVALTGNLAHVGFDTWPDRLALLVRKLQHWYAPETEVILYEAAQVPIEPFRAERLPLADLPRARYREYTTLVIPPARPLEVDERWLSALRELD
jgi:siroheme synthase